MIKVARLADTVGTVAGILYPELTGIAGQTLHCIGAPTAGVVAPGTYGNRAAKVVEPVHAGAASIDHQNAESNTGATTRAAGCRA